MPTYLTEDEALKRLLRACERRGGQLRFAQAHAISPQFVNDVIRGRAKVSSQMAPALGLRRVILYELLPADPPPTDTFRDIHRGRTFTDQLPAGPEETA